MARPARPAAALSPRLRALLEALPLAPGLRVLEIGCGPGALARAIAQRVAPGGFVLGIDRSARAVAQAVAASGGFAPGLLAFRRCAAEDFMLARGEPGFDLVVAVRVGAFDGRHPAAGARARPRVAAALRPGGRFVVDGVVQALPR